MPLLRKAFFLFVSIVAAPCFADDETLQVCTAGGYFSGADDKFLIGLATHILVKKDALDTEPCRTAWSKAYDVGVLRSRSVGKPATESELAIIKSAAKFSGKAYSAIVKSMER